ncbi:glycosyltransferase [Lutibacter sp.]|uniref:glycosyltransferase n=1 Tax=Lutibacter sp. TaxID=1925666 RepID=UPI0025C2DFDB|nr:glycosyltransferase [Lutibacter sp.]MCF6167012.1 glycosyltransferase family 4 protein [Lutibacter sp.]
MKDLLIIGFVWPEPNTTAAGSRMLQLIELFQDNNYNITFVCAASKTSKSFNLDDLNIQTFNIELNNSSFDELIKRLNPSLVLFDRYITEEQFGWRVVKNCPNALRILDTEDLHFLRNARQTAYNKKIPVSENLLKNDVAKREIASIYRCDLTLIISKYEIKLLKRLFGVDKSLLHYVPFLLKQVNLPNSYPSFIERKDFIAIGNFKHAPNLDSVMYLKTTIWPLIKKDLPNAKLHVYGAYATQKIQQLHSTKDGFLVNGWAESIENIFTNARVCLAPLQFGAGLKGKLIDAMKYGTPSLTTTIGAEAMHNKLPWNGFITNNPIDFALKSVKLYTDELIWKNSQQNGTKIVHNCYSKEKYGNKLINKINFLQKQIIEHRLNNFTGTILMHHTLNSTKYFSKWIEEKNK